VRWLKLGQRSPGAPATPSAIGGWRGRYGDRRAERAQDFKARLLIDFI
jgi:hypothetical protein